ncbi:hypothetical protein N2W54_001219 [Lotmaria passim]
MGRVKLLALQDAGGVLNVGRRPQRGSVAATEKAAKALLQRRLACAELRGHLICAGFHACLAGLHAAHCQLCLRGEASVLGVMLAKHNVFLKPEVVQVDALVTTAQERIGRLSTKTVAHDTHARLASAAAAEFDVLQQSGVQGGITAVAFMPSQLQSVEDGVEMVRQCGQDVSRASQRTQAGIPLFQVLVVAVVPTAAMQRCNDAVSVVGIDGAVKASAPRF